jgi:hypothetical protein
MRKLSIIALAVFAFACSKKQNEVQPTYSGSSSERVSSSSTSKAKSLDEQIKEAVDAVAPKLSNVTATSAVLTLGDETLFLEKSGDDVTVSTLSSAGARTSGDIVASSSASNGGFAGVMILIDESNVKEFAKWISKEAPNNPFQELFGDELYDVLTKGPSDNTKPKIKLNTKGLPSGAFELNGEIVADGKGKGTTTKSGALVPSGEKVTIDGDAGMYVFHVDEQIYGQIGTYDLSFLVTTDFSEDDYITALGETYKGAKDPKNAEGFTWIIGFGKGGSKPPMTGVLISVGYKKGAESAVFTLAAFKGLKIK